MDPRHDSVQNGGPDASRFSMATIEIPAIRLDRDMFDTIRQGLLVVLSLLSFWIMAAAETSHHTEFHYSFYPSLTFFVWVGVLSFVYSVGLMVGKATHALSDQLREPLETYGPFILLWLTYTAAIAASATSTDLHATFDENDGPVCKSRQSRARAVAGAFFCGHLVSATVFMYGLVVTYVATIANNLSSGGGFTPGGFATGGRLPRCDPTAAGFA